MTMGRSMRRIYSTHLCEFVNELIVQNTNNVSLKILVASSGLTMVGKSFSNQITLVSFLTVSFHSVCGKRQVNTPTHMQRNRVQKR